MIYAIFSKLDASYLLSVFIVFLVMQGLPFRTSHEIVGRLVALCTTRGYQLSDLSLDEFRSVNNAFEEDVYDFLGIENSVKKFSSYGSTGSKRVADQMDYWLTKLGLIDKPSMVKDT